MVDLGNLQSLLAQRSLKPVYAVLLFRVGAPAGARAFLRALLPRVVAGDSAAADGTPLINVFLSWNAIAALLGEHPDLDLTVGRRQLEPFFTDPRQGPDSVAMADQLGFVGPSAPAHWWSGFRTQDIELAVYLGCDDEDQRQALLQELRVASEAADMQELNLPSFPENAASGYLPAGGRLHFGYRDGITTPDVDWEDAGRPGATNLREFVLGYWTEDYPTSPYPLGPWRDFARDGSFACLTWIYQDVARFETFLADHALAVVPPTVAGDPREWLAARLVGRWRDGSPLVRHPTTPPDAPDLDDTFGFADDPVGVRCPLGAHIRVVQCRDQPFSFANESRFPNGPPRLIRRGFSYGSPLAAAEDDGHDRGLFGVFLCARVNEQFYTVLRWMQQTEFSPVFNRGRPGRAGQDMLAGSRLPGGANQTPDTNIWIETEGTSTPVSLQPFIRYKGVAILFVPSMAALRVLATA